MSTKLDSKCPVCLEDVRSRCDLGIAARCGHMIHYTCFEVLLECGEHSCPVCGQLETNNAELKSPISTVGVPHVGSCNHIVAPPSNSTYPPSLNEHYSRSTAIDSFSHVELQLGDMSNEFDVDFLCPECNSEIAVFNNDMGFSLDLHCQTLVHLKSQGIHQIREHRTSISDSFFDIKYKHKMTKKERKSLKENTRLQITSVKPKTSEQTLTKRNAFLAASQYDQPTSHKQNLKKAFKPPNHPSTGSSKQLAQYQITPFIPETSTTGPSKLLTQQRIARFIPETCPTRPPKPFQQRRFTSNIQETSITGTSKPLTQQLIAPFNPKTSTVGPSKPSAQSRIASLSNTIHSIPEPVAKLQSTNVVYNSSNRNLEEILCSLPKELYVSKNDLLYKKKHVVCLLCSCKVPVSNTLLQPNLITHVKGVRHKTKVQKRKLIGTLYST